MKIILLGGSGLIGSEIAASLLSSGYQVIILTRNSKLCSSNTTQKQFVLWDGKSSQGWISHLIGDYAIINLAGESIAGERFTDMQWTPLRKKRILESRVNASLAACEAIAIAEQKPKVYIQASAIGYYGSSISDTIFTEESQAGKDFLAYVCTQWEKTSEILHELKIRRVIMRIGVVLSEKGGALPKQLMPFRFFMGGNIGSGEQWYSWIHIHDVVKAVHFFIENEKTAGTYNLTAPNPITNKQFTHIIAKLLKKPAWFTVPSFMLYHLLGEASILLTLGQRVIPQHLIHDGFQFAFPTCELAVTDLLKRS